MELRHLRYFQAVAELESFTRAAEKLFVAQPPLSLQIRQLEEELGTPLLLRHARGVSLTPAGAGFLASTRDILNRVEQAKSQVRRTAQGVAGVVRLGFVPSASHSVIPRLVARVKASHPGIELDVCEMITPEQVDALQAQRIDVGLARPPMREAGLLVIDQLADPFCIALPAEHALAQGTFASLALRRLAQEPMVGYTRYRAPAFFDQIVSLCIQAGFSPQLRYEVSTIHSILDLVSAGLGVAIVPASCALLPTRNVVFRPLTAASRKGSLALVRRAGICPHALSQVSAEVSAIFKELKTEVATRLTVQARF
ncbi:MAG: hypothetical protein RLZZ401_284 [Pseudomonadota bacterium]|jgi:DNA-binding transcriptional LysR family regulator